ncbi:MAG: EAL domain-containing protein [Campylobacterota bacterium]|nr:EAL domain-containing protein [Campylobacterota bacterium]
MQFFKHPLFFIGTFALLFFVVNESFTYVDELEKRKIELYEKNKLILKNLTDAQARNVQILAEVLSVDHAVIDGYLKNDPEIIKEHVAPLWKRVKDKKLTHEIHFFKPPAISFVNFSNFKSIGHDVADVRTDIEWITSSFKPSSHALMCKTYAGYRATHPIYDENGTMLGGLSLGKKVDWIPHAVKEKTTNDSFLIYNQSATNSLKPKYYNAFMQGKTQVGSHILADSTFEVDENIIPSIEFSKEIQEITINGDTYTLYMYPIVDFNKNIMGYVGVVTQLKVFKENFISTALQSLVIVAISVLIVLLISKNRISHLFREIEVLKNITKKIKKRNFGFLREKRDKNAVSTDSLVKLQNNILDMGRELERQYIELEDENRAKSEQLIKQLYRDGLTGLANRAALFRDLREREGSYIAILNIRNFKEINDAFGFKAGNSILKELARVCEPYALNKGFSLYRIGSDEYVLTRYNQKSGVEFKKFIIDLIEKVERSSFEINSDGINIDVNINMYAGICFEKERGLAKASMALTHAKEDKKDFIIYSSKEDTKSIHVENIVLINKLTKALSSGDIVVFYQAIVDRDEEIVKYEALVRMRDTDKILSPFVFLEVSKRTKYYSEVTKVVIEKTFEQVELFDKAISINLTADDILNDKTMALINKKMSQCSTPGKIVFELVESDDLYNLDEIEIFIKDIKSRGAKIAIDDFGTGYSNFSYMMKIKPDYLKIDGSIIKNLDSDENARKILRTIISFSKELDIKVIAEYVHSRDIYEICREFGVDEFQGYYFSEPSSLD